MHFEGEQGYLDLAKLVLASGEERLDERTGHRVISLFSPPKLIFRDVEQRFPLITTKRMAWDCIRKELAWFIRGDTDSTILSDDGVKIWQGNTSREFLDSRGLPHYQEGDIGAGYGFQWRHWGADYTGCLSDYDNKGIDQLKEALRLLREDPGSRRNVVSAWNVSQLKDMALPPCHKDMQFNVSADGKRVNCMMTQRSADIALGLPFNIASYAALLTLMARLAGREAGDLTISIGDAHIYKDHVEGMKVQLERTPMEPPRLVVAFPTQLDPAAVLDTVGYECFAVVGYKHHPPIAFKMAV